MDRFGWEPCRESLHFIPNLILRRERERERERERDKRGTKKKVKKGIAAVSYISEVFAGFAFTLEVSITGIESGVCILWFTNHVLNKENCKTKYYIECKRNKYHPFNSRRGRLEGPKNVYTISGLNLIVFSEKGVSCSVLFTPYCLYR